MVKLWVVPPAAPTSGRTGVAVGAVLSGGTGTASPRSQSLSAVVRNHQLNLRGGLRRCTLRPLSGPAGRTQYWKASSAVACRSLYRPRYLATAGPSWRGEI